MATPSELLELYKQCADTLQKANTMAFDLTRQFGNMGQVVSTGKAGALALADTLAAAPVGDAARVRSNIGAQPSGDYMSGSATLMTVPPGADWWQVRQRMGLGNDDAGRQSLGLGGPTIGDKYNACRNLGLTEAGVFTSHLKYVPPFGGQRPTGFYAEQWTEGLGEMAGVVHIQFNGEAEGDGLDNRFILELGGEQGGVYYSALHNGEWKFQRAKFYTSLNTTIDGNGFLKAASPVFRVGNMLDTLTSRDFFPAGDGVANGEARGVTCERVSEGIYKVTGARGLADDGVWTVETPKDENGQPLLWVNTAQAADGTITVETYHREHPSAPPFARNKVEGKLDGDSIDIPSGRWIDLRLKMPEKPE